MSVATVDVTANYRGSPASYTCARYACKRIREAKHERVIAIRAATAAFIRKRKIDIERAGAAVDFPGHDSVQLHRRQRVMLREREADTTVVVVADGPAVRGRDARHAIEEVAQRGAGVGRGDDGPGGPVPALDQSLTEAGAGEADGPTLRRRHACHAKEIVVLRGAGVGRGDNGPGGPVPALDQGLIHAALNGVAGVVPADGPAVGRRHARHGVEVVVLRGVGVGRADDGPRGPVPPLDERLVDV